MSHSDDLLLSIWSVVVRRAWKTEFMFIMFMKASTQPMNDMDPESEVKAVWHDQYGHLVKMY